MSEPLLHHVDVAGSSPGRWLYVAHGIFGAGRNWASIARRLVGERPEWGVRLLDLRLHGHSQGFAPPHTLVACAHDIVELADARGGRPAAILGHSFGGKVALVAAGWLHLEAVWVIDSTPSRRTPGGGAHRMLGILRRLPGPFASRDEAAGRLEAHGVAPFVARWMATNLERRDGGYRWIFDLDGLESLLDDFFRTDLWDMAESPPEPTRVHFVKATESDVMTEAECERLEGPRASDRTAVHRLHGGHWIHVDDPDGLLALLVAELP